MAGYGVTTSSSTVTIGIGLKSFVVTSIGDYKIGSRTRVIFDSANYVEGIITNISVRTVSVMADFVLGSGTRSRWTFSLAGQLGNPGATGASGASSTVTLTFSTRPATPFSVGSTIVVTGFTPSGYNGTFTVTACTTTSVSYTNSTTATMTVAGQSASTTAVYPSANFTSAIITGSASLQASTAVTAFAIDADTDALVSATFTGKATTNTIASNVSLTVTEAGATGSGYYLKFSSPVPYGKIVTALIGFDQ